MRLTCISSMQRHEKWCQGSWASKDRVTEALSLTAFCLPHYIHDSEACPQIIDEFVKAVMGRWPEAVLQFEDFNMTTAQPLLQRYRNSHLVFNDDIQVLSCLVTGILTARCCSEQGPDGVEGRSSWF